MTHIQQFTALRHSLGLSQSQAAKLLEVSVRTVQSWEQNERTFKPRYIVDLKLRFKAQNLPIVAI